MAIDFKNQLWGWGTNSNRQIGTGTNEHCRQPEKIWTIQQVKSVSCGTSHTVAIDNEGCLWVWGEDKAWNDQSDIATPMLVNPDHKYSAVFAGENVTYAIDTANRLVVWGEVSSSKIPRALIDKAKEGIIKLSNVHLESDLKPKFIVCASQHILMLEASGYELWGWGKASGGRLGIATDALQETPHKLLSLDTREVKQDEVETEETFLQEKLVMEPEEQKERFLLESDKILMADFDAIVEMFLEIIEAERSEESFYQEAGRKMLARISAQPFKAKVQTLKQDEQLNGIVKVASYLITTFQLHPCYVYNLLMVNKRYKEVLDLIYVNMENDSRLICAALLLSRRLLEKSLAKANTKEEINAVLDNIIYTDNDYHYLINLIIKASVEDMRKLRDITRHFISLMTQKISDDKLGIVTNPVKAARKENVNAVNAYATNKKTVERRVDSLKSVLEECFKYLSQGVSNGTIEFSSIATLIFKDLLGELHKKPHVLRLEELLRDNVKKYVKVSIFLLFEELFKALKSPIDYGIGIDLNFEDHKGNLENLSINLQRLFLKESQETKELWMVPIKKLVEHEESYKKSYSIVKKIVDRSVSLDKELLTVLFDHSLKQYDIQVNVPYSSIASLSHDCITKIDKIRINTGKYDPIVLINKSSEVIPKVRPEEIPPNVNLTLLTRSLRHEQSLVRCPICRGIVVREMAPTTYEQVFKLFEPMAPTSPVAMLNDIFVKGPKKSSSIALEAYLTNFKQSCVKGGMDLKSANIIDQIKGAIEMQVTTESSRAISEGIQAKLSDEVVALVRNQLYERLERDCYLAYLSRKTHFAEAELMRSNLEAVKEMLVKHTQDRLSSGSNKQELMFNLEYGASNRDLLVYSDPVMFRIFMQKVKDYTDQRPMSIQLFENLKGNMTQSLQGFSQIKLKSLKSNRTIIDVIGPEDFNYNAIEISIEQIEAGYMFVFFMPATAGVLFGESKMREDKIFGYHRLLKKTLVDLSRRARTDTADIYEVKLLNDAKIVFSTGKLVKLMDKIDSQVIIYSQNAKMASESQASENQPLKATDEEFKTEDRE